MTLVRPESIKAISCFLLAALPLPSGGPSASFGRGVRFLRNRLLVRIRQGAYTSDNLQAGLYGLYRTIGIERQGVDAHLAVVACTPVELWSTRTLEAVIDNAPLVRARLLQDGMMACAENLILVVALQDNGLLCSRNGRTVTHKGCGRIADGITDAVVL